MQKQRGAKQIVVVPSQNEKSFSGVFETVGRNKEEENRYGAAAGRGRKRASQYITVNTEG